MPLKSRPWGGLGWKKCPVSKAQGVTTQVDQGLWKVSRPCLSNVQPQYNEDTNSTSTAPPTTLPYAIPTIAENYRDYSRQTNETPAQSLRPTYYSGAFAGNNTATQGLGARGSLPYFYNTGSYSNISSKTIGPNNFMAIDLRITGNIDPATTYTFNKYNNSTVNNNSVNTYNFSKLWLGSAGTGGAISFARNFLFGGQSIFDKLIKTCLVKHWEHKSPKRALITQLESYHCTLQGQNSVQKWLFL